MSDLFLHLYLDEDVHVLIADLIRARGFAATTTRDAALLTLADSDQLTYAASQGMTLVTHNRDDFEQLAEAFFAAGQPHAGIIIAVRRPPYEIARRLLVLLNDVPRDEMINQLRYI